MIRDSTLHHIRTSLQSHGIHVDATVNSIGKFIFETSGVYTRSEQAEMCNIGRQLVFVILDEYSDERPVFVGRKYLMVNGKTLTEWIILNGDSRLSWYCLYKRLSRGWSLQDSLLTPVRRWRRRKQIRR